MTTMMANTADKTAAPTAESSDRTFRIGDLAREFDVTLRTLRFYEDKGLIEPERRGTSRIYSAQDRERLSLALFCKRIGLALSDIRQVLHKHDAGETEQVRAIYREQRSVLEGERERVDAALQELDTRLSA